MDSEEKKYWVGFSVFKGIGPARFKLLIDYFGSAKKAFCVPEKQLRDIGLGEKLVTEFLGFRESFDFPSYFLRLKNLGIEVVCSEEESYPKLLKEIADRPPVIYVREGPEETEEQEGRKIFQKKAVAVVGTRKVTSYGRQVTEMIVEGLSTSGLVVVSGLARGVDKIAHEHTIYSKGLTIGVLGCGLDLIYPPEHKGLAERIVETGGAIVSEFPLGMQAVPGNFPARNRIISGISLGVVVTEAAQDSGSLITASCAAEQGREVFAVPGPITSPLSVGTSELIKKGAKLVSGVGDILEELKIDKGFRDLGRRDLENLNGEEKKIVEILENENLHFDEIVRKVDKDTGELGAILSMMEVKGVIKNFGEGIYGLC